MDIKSLTAMKVCGIPVIALAAVAVVAVLVMKDKKKQAGY